MKNHGKKVVITLKVVVYPLLVLLLFLSSSYRSIEVNANEVTEYELWVGGVRVTSENMSGEGWVFERDGNQSKLTLINANITDSFVFYGVFGERKTAGIYSNEKNLELEFVGTNKISNSDFGICCYDLSVGQVVGGTLLTENTYITLDYLSHISIGSNYKLINVVSQNGRTSGGGFFLTAGEETISFQAIPDTGYSFVNWMSGYTILSTEQEYSTSKRNIASKVTATFSPINYTIKFVNYDGTELQSSSVAYGQWPVYSGETPTKELLQHHIYTFKGWSPAISYVTGDQTYTAKYDETVERYTITFVNEDGTVLQTVRAIYGYPPTYSAGVPTKEATAQYTYTFKGWSPAISRVVGDKTYTATYDATVNNYTIKFVNEDGTELQSGSVAYGQTPAYNGGTPTKEATAQYTYSFKGWSPAISPVSGNETYTAEYSSHKITESSGGEGANGKSSGGSGVSVPSESSGNSSGTGTLIPVQTPMSEPLKEETQKNKKESNVSQKDGDQRVIEQINSDGTKTRTVIDTISDGTTITKTVTLDKNNNVECETVIRERTTSSGTKISLKEILKSDGTKVEEDQRIYKSGKTVVKKETWKADGTYIYDKTVFNVDGSNVIDVKKSNPDGSTEKTRINIDKEGEITVSAIITNESGDVSEVPDVIDIDGEEYKVDNVIEKAFFKNSTLTSLMLGKNITYIGDKAFKGAKNLSTITILSKKIKTIDTQAFYGISKNAVIKIKAGKTKFDRIVDMIKASGIKKGVRFERVE